MFRRATIANLKKKKKIGDWEAIGGVFMCKQWLFWRKNRDSLTVGDALKGSLMHWSLRPWPKDPW